MTMARTPKTSIFKGIQAIEAAGGVDGFVREVLAESKRLSLETINRQTAPMGDAGCKRILLESINDVMFRRLETDIERGICARVADAIRSCKSVDEIEAASERAMVQAEQWSRDLVEAVQVKIFGVGLLNH